MLRVKAPTGTDLRNARMARLLSQKDLAALVGCSVRAVQNWEAGATPQFRHQRALLRALEELEDVA